jgi:hypothetical protein
MNRLTIALLVTLAAACSTVRNDPPPPAPDAAADLLPPAHWWRDPFLNEALKLTDAQLEALDRISAEHSAEVDRQRADVASAARDLRAALNADHPTATELAAAGQRLRTARDAMLGEELEMLAAERAVLSHAQWEALEDQLRAAGTRRRGGDYPRRGGYPRGGGRRPGGGGRWP